MEEPLKLFMVLLGSKPADPTVEQHHYFFGIAGSLQELVPQMIRFWPEAGSSLHIDGWREITHVESYEVRVTPKTNSKEAESGKRLFFVNLGGYQSGKLEEQHYTLLRFRMTERVRSKFLL